ncbi:DNA-binding response regulator [Enterococcus ureilyticus]|uniref:DNA-binding response regulator n=1 Tax=Enterococcus ureilyticus TaxID=1131292 RepID=A0A1E5HE56_9ENTE|nr:response regulator transcription factor [Enterococcus ureilyticus]MBM7689753.1 two-component system KDP operon response regulator KdpE [Enterococcus ureilyticus]OEG23228.1 DNA-binding response regulator [Enterococcus ureilyticus]
MATILIIEDDDVIAEFMGAVLAKEKHTIHLAHSALEGLSTFRMWSIDLILLDLGLPDQDGIEVLKKIRETSSVPIIIISARDHENNKVEALDLGADDYITKPFGTPELLARIRTALRHAVSNAGSQTEIKKIINGELCIDIEHHTVSKQGKEIHLTPNEYKIIQVLGENIGKVLTHTYISQKVWGPYSNESQTLRVNMSNIRKKIEDNPVEPEFIMTEIGIGYRMLEK